LGIINRFNKSLLLALLVLLKEAFGAAAVNLLLEQGRTQLLLDPHLLAGPVGDGHGAVGDGEAGVLAGLDLGLAVLRLDGVLDLFPDTALLCVLVIELLPRLVEAGIET
jgi:hypothetical protein